MGESRDRKSAEGRLVLKYFIVNGDCKCRCLIISLSVGSGHKSYQKHPFLRPVVFKKINQINYIIYKKHLKKKTKIIENKKLFLQNKLLLLKIGYNC